MPVDFSGKDLYTIIFRIKDFTLEWYIGVSPKNWLADQVVLLEFSLHNHIRTHLAVILKD